MGGILDKKNYLHPSIKAITSISMIITLVVVLDNLISYKFFIFGSGIRLSLGNFLIFVAGMIFGPFYGVLTGIASDCLGLIVGINGTYCAIFTLDKTLLGFMGAFAYYFEFKKIKSYIKTIIIFSTCFIVISFFNNSIYLLSYFYDFNFKALYPIFITKLIKLPFELIIYNILIFSCYNVLYLIINKNAYDNNIWILNKKNI